MPESNTARRLPDFIIIGGMKCGTTSLYHYLNEHPGIYMSDPKEPSFFAEEKSWGKGWDWYHSLFAPAGAQQITGEASTCYTLYPRFQDAPEKIREYLPDVKLIYIMREPLKRILSHYWYWVKCFDETRKLPLALREDPVRYIEPSRYAAQLERYFERFPQSRFHIITIEALEQEPVNELQSCFRFLGVDADFVPTAMDQQHNVGPQVLSQRHVPLQRLRRILRPIKGLIPEFVKARVQGRGTRQVQRTDRFPDSLYQELRHQFDIENEKLFGLIDRRFDEWIKPSSAP